MTGSAPDPIVGRLVDGRYRVLHHIADGGMGSVYVAVDERLDRQVAVKVMRPDLARDASFVERFRREARSAARLGHPHVVAVYDQGQDGDLVFLAMEYVDGTTLRDLLEVRGALPPREALRLVRQILDALAAAHRAGLVHRDVKPENVLITPEGQVKVADFGLARAVTAVTTTTLGAMVLGTVSYLSPEQVESGAADARSDVYAVGLVLYEMLTGARAVDGNTPIQVAYRHVHGEIPVPSSHRRGLARGLDELVAEATRRDPRERPADAAAFLRAVVRAEASLTPKELDLLGRDPAAGAADGRSVLQTDRLIRQTQPVPHVAAGLGTSDLGQPPTPAGTGETKPPRRVSPPTRILAALTVALMLVGGSVGWYMFAGPGSQRTVPAVRGLGEQDAVAALAAVDLFADVIPTFHEAIAAGQVISVDPDEGSTVRRATPVGLAVSKGQERYVVPDVVGQPINDARKDVTDTRLTVGSVTESFSETVSTGQVISTDPVAGSKQKRDAPIALILSKGREPLAVRDWTGTSYDEAAAALQKQGLVPQILSEEFSNDVPPGAIIKQTPAAGTAYKGTQVTFTVSKGPDLVTIPGVTGKSEREATDILRAAGFEVEVFRIAGGLFGTAHSTDPGSGAKAPRGSKITLRVV